AGDGGAVDRGDSLGEWDRRSCLSVAVSGSAGRETGTNACPTGAGMKKELTRQQYLDLYYYMRLNRAVEDTMVKLFRQNKIVGGLYSSLGQEAISVGSAYALEKKDWLGPMIRNIGALLGKGVPPRGVFMQH